MNQYSTLLMIIHNSFTFDNLVTFEHACEPSLIWDMLSIYIYIGLVFYYSLISLLLFVN